MTNKKKHSLRACTKSALAQQGHCDGSDRPGPLSYYCNNPKKKIQQKNNIVVIKFYYLRNPENTGLKRWMGELLKYLETLDICEQLMADQVKTNTQKTVYSRRIGWNQQRQRTIGWE